MEFQKIADFVRITGKEVVDAGIDQRKVGIQGREVVDGVADILDAP